MDEKNDAKNESTSETVVSEPKKSTRTKSDNPTTDSKVTAHSPRRVRWLQIIFIGLIIGVIGFGAGWLGAQSQQNGDVDPVVTKQRVVLNNQGDLISTIAEEVGTSVVSVNVTSRTSDNYWFGGSYEQQSAGTGIILTAKGLIITNRHVVPEGTTGVQVVLSDGSTFDAELVGRTSESDPLDIAFIKITDLGNTKLTPAKLGKSSDMKVGHSVVAIGNALGQFQNTVTMGILSGYGRNVVAGDGYSQGENLEDLFQTDAAINQGNSGGPLVNMSGEVIGINTAVAGDGAENIGFAIPIDNIQGLIANVEKTGKLERPYLGVVYVMLNDELAKQYELKVDEGAYIVPAGRYGQDTIVDQSPADKAGVKEGDVIIKVDNHTINTESKLASVLSLYAPGDMVKITINRAGEIVVLDTTLASRPE